MHCALHAGIVMAHRKELSASKVQVSAGLSWGILGLGVGVSWFRGFRVGCSEGHTLTSHKKHPATLPSHEMYSLLCQAAKRSCCTCKRSANIIRSCSSVSDYHSTHAQVRISCSFEIIQGKENLSPGNNNLFYSKCVRLPWHQ